VGLAQRLIARLIKLAKNKERNDTNRERGNTTDGILILENGVLRTADQNH
jgi:hypothetical protein